jgi:hypothetical protein
MIMVEMPVIRYDNGKYTNTHGNAAAEGWLEIFIEGQAFLYDHVLPGEEIPLAVRFLTTPAPNELLLKIK